MSTRRHGRQLVIIGAGGCGRELLDLVEAVNAAADPPAYDFLGFLDDKVQVPRDDARAPRAGEPETPCPSHASRPGDPQAPQPGDPEGDHAGALASAPANSPRTRHLSEPPGRPPADVDLLARRGTRLLGGLELLNGLDVDYLIGVGSAAARSRIDRYASAAGRRPATLVHPAAHIGGDVRLGPGTAVCALASVTTNVATGRHVLVDVGASVAHDCRIGDYVTLAPGARVSGGVELGPRVWVGSQANVVRDRRVGAGAVVGAGAIVIDDVAPDLVVAGIPARPIAAADLAGLPAEHVRPPAWPPPRREPGPHEQITRRGAGPVEIACAPAARQEAGRTAEDRQHGRRQAVRQETGG